VRFRRPVLLKPARPKTCRSQKGKAMALTLARQSGNPENPAPESFNVSGWQILTAEYLLSQGVPSSAAFKAASSHPDLRPVAEAMAVLELSRR
jgi:hypothetical protein